jgi:PAS domain S-box-containing protein
MVSAAPAATQAGRTYEQYRNYLIVRGVTLPAVVVFLVTALYATSEAFYAPQRFWPGRWAYLAETLTPLVACWLCRGRLRQHAQLVLLGADLTYSVGVLVQALQPTTAIAGAALAVAIKVMATAVFFPWQPRLQYISASVTIVGYWTVLYLGGRIGSADSALFQTLGPGIAAVLSAAGAAGIDRNRRAMFEARAWLQLATESAKVVLWTCDLRTLTIRFSSGRKRVLGRDESEITLAAQWDLVHPDDRTEAIATLQAHLQQRTSLYENERRMLHADGSYRWMLIRSTSAYDIEGQPCVQYGADIDITERKQLEEALRCSEEKYRQLVEDIGEAIYAIDATGTLTYVSPVAESLYGYAPAEIVNRPFTDFVPAEDVPGLRQGFAATSSGTPNLRDHRIVTKAGDIRWVRNSARTVTEARGIGLRGVLTDVTERRRIEHELQALTKDLDARVIERTRQLSEALEQVDAGRERLKMLSQRLIDIQETERRHFARELHDEIGQMLTGLQFLLHGLRDLPPAAAKQMAEAEQLVSDLCGQVRDLSLELRPAVLDDMGLLPALLWLFGRYTTQTGITVAFEHRALEQRFPAEQETAAYRIVQEALTNVARHARVTAVTVRAWVEDGLLGVQIADEGVGFDTEKALAAGTSGGLAGMRERALLVGGTLRITSVPGRRTEVSVYIPTS